MFRIVIRLSVRARAMSARSPFTSVMPALAIATSVPVPIGILTLAAASAGAKRSYSGFILQKGALPATDLHGYLGGAACAVFINEKTFTYAHVHPTIGSDAEMAGMNMSGNVGAMKEAPAIADTARVPTDFQLHVGAQVPGRYRL